MHFNWYTIGILVSLMITLSALIIGWKHRNANGGRAFILLMLTIIFWLSSSFFIAVSSNYMFKLFWFNLRFFFASASSVAFFTMVLHFFGKDKWLSRKHLIWMMVIPVTSFIMAWTNPLHYVFVEMRTGEFGFYFWIHSGYSFVILMLGISILFQAAFQSHHVFRRQAGVMLAGAIFPIGTSFIEAYRFITPNSESFIPISFSISSIAIAWAISKYRLLDLIPVARRTVIDTMRDGVIVLDNQKRIVDINSSATAILKNSFLNVKHDFLGEMFLDIVGDNEEIRNALNSPDISNTEIALQNEFESRWYNLNLSMLIDDNSGQTGMLLIWHDITKMKIVQNEKEELIGDLKTALQEVKTLSGLLPICSSCKKIRDDEGYWHKLENYFHDHTDVDFSHGICPGCMKKLYPNYKPE